MQLLESGHAYYAFDTPEELDSMRKEYEARGETFVYDARVRESLKNSLTMQALEVEEKIASGTPYVIRFRFEPNKEIVMQDMVRGEVVVSTSTLDDKILFKSDGMPTYHLANVVDDNLMAISHVIRGEEWLPSLPLHVSLYSAFGWEHLMPKFAHLPLILKPTGKGKLSKRDGEKGGFPVFPLEWKDPISGEISPGYREEGYLPEGCINMLALLGWNPGTEQELFSLDEDLSVTVSHCISVSTNKRTPAGCHLTTPRIRVVIKFSVDILRTYIPLATLRPVSSWPFQVRLCRPAG